MWICRHCGQEFEFERNTNRANHSRHCKHNPKRIASYAKIKESINRTHEEKLGAFKDFDVTCFSCSKIFQVNEREYQFPLRDKYFCSRSCSNVLGGRAKAAKHHPDEIASYTTVAWRHHDKVCLVCGEDKIVAVHHVNENHDDNRPENLVPLCPTHHQYIHSRYRHLIEDQVNEYVRVKWAS